MSAAQDRFSPCAGARAGAGSAARLRQAGPDDATGFSLLHANLFAEPWDEQAMHTLLFAPANFGLALETEQGLAGLVIYSVAADEAEILTLGVALACRRLGLGRVLLDAVCTRAIADGATTIFLEVDVDNKAALGLYRAAGFFIVGRRKGYYARSAALTPELDVQGAAGAGARDALMMKRDLMEARA